MMGKIPNKLWYHNPLIKTSGGNTVAMELAYNGFISPKYWEH